MAQGLILLAYNAYYNRFLKSESSLQSYLDNSEGSDYFLMNVNFNPADGLNTTHTIGNGELDNRLEFRDYSFTYALLIEYDPELKTREEIYASENTKIISKWFVLDNDRVRGGQYKITLRRDVLVDYMKQIKKSPIFVEKGIISDVNSPLLLNNEDCRVNQIKKREVLLKDKSTCAWLVMYLKKGVLGSNSVGPNGNGKITVDVPKDNSFIYLELTTPITSWSYYQYVNNDYNTRLENSIIVWHKETSNSISGHKYTLNSNNYREYVLVTNATRSNLFSVHVNIPNLDSAFKPQFNTVTSQLDTAFGFKNLSTLMAFNNKIIKDSTGKYFMCYVESTGNIVTNTYNITSDNAATAKATLANCWNTANGSSQSPNDGAFQTKIKSVAYRIRLEELEDVNTTLDFSTFTGKGTTDSMLFDAICMPFGEIGEYIAYEASEELQTQRERSLRIMNSIATQLTSQYVLDLQLLPYCPVQDVLNDYYSDEDKIYIDEDNIGKLVLRCYDVNGTTDILLVCPSSNFTFDIEQEIKIDDYSDVADNFKIKYLNDCTALRICSPNYNGLFDMNIAKNGGIINSFNVDVTLRPFNPYIHVNPDFNFLYGEDFNDVRGLICNGDFSLGIINDAWNTYEIQNKNYQAIFDRQIQNLDLNNSIARQEAGWGIAAGVLSGGAAGAAGGAIVGGGWGALAGAVIGAGSSAVGGALDWANLQKRQSEARDYAIDNYNLQLGNVRALPYSITKTSALTFNNKLFPFVEIYECSEEEKEAYYNKIYWNGMTIGIIDRIEKYMSNNWANYFRGKLIALYGEEGSNAVENRIIEAINMELMKGVFI